MNITEYVPIEIDDEDVRQMFQNFLWHRVSPDSCRSVVADVEYLPS